MKKITLLLLSAALMLGLGSCTPSEPDLKKTDYLKLVHSTVNTTAAKADKTLTRKGFTAVDITIKTDGLEAVLCDKAYEFRSKDGSTLLHVGLVIKNDSVKQYVLNAELEGDQHKKDVQKLYSEWSHEAYNTIFAEIALWGNTWFAENDLSNFGVMYMDGAWASAIKNAVTLYHAAGRMDDDVYNVLMAGFERKYADWEAEMASANFLQEEGSLYESYAHGTGNFDLAALMAGDLSGLRGTFGTMSTEIKEKSGVKHWEISFVYLNEVDLSSMGNFPF